MSTIPEIRNSLAIIALNLRLEGNKKIAKQIEYCVEELHRRQYVRKAPVKSHRMTPKLKTEIRQYAADNPKASLMEIGTRFGVSNGRISETLRGKRT